jgi:hypothetical protein
MLKHSCTLAHGCMILVICSFASIFLRFLHLY